MLSPSITEEALEWIQGRIAGGKVSWAKVATLASHHLVTPALYTAFRNLKTDPGIPEDFEAYLEGMHYLNTERNRSILAEVTLVTEVLNSHGVEPVLLKGVGSLVTGLYPDRGDRVIADIDLLVSAGQFESTLSALSRAGFRSIPKLGKEGDKLWNSPYPGHHAPGLIRPDGPCVVEVHHSLWSSLEFRGVEPEDVIDESKPIELAQLRARIPADWHRFLHTIIHSQISHRHFNYGSMILRELWDSSLMMERFSALDLKKVEMSVDKAGYSRAYLAYLDWMQRFFCGLPVGSYRVPITYRFRQEARLRVGLYRSIENLLLFSLQGLRNFARRVQLKHLSWGRLPSFLWVRLKSERWRKLSRNAVVRAIRRN